MASNLSIWWRGSSTRSKSSNKSATSTNCECRKKTSRLASSSVWSRRTRTRWTSRSTGCNRPLSSRSLQVLLIKRSMIGLPSFSRCYKMSWRSSTRTANRPLYKGGSPIEVCHGNNRVHLMTTLQKKNGKSYALIEPRKPIECFWIPPSQINNRSRSRSRVSKMPMFKSDDSSRLRSSKKRL